MSNNVAAWRAVRATLLTVLSLILLVLGMVIFGVASTWILVRDIWAGFYGE